MPARTRRVKHDDRTREKIRTSQLINRLQANALGHIEELSQSRIKSIEILLRKVLPDLAAVEHSGELEHAHYDISDKPLEPNEWAKRYADDQSLAPPDGASKSIN